MAAAKYTRRTPLRKLTGDLRKVYAILNMNKKWMDLAGAVTGRDDLPKFTEDIQFFQIANSPNPAETVIRTMYTDNRDVGFLLQLLEDLNLVRAANEIRGFLGESPLEPDTRPEHHPSGQTQVFPGNQRRYPSVPTEQIPIPVIAIPPEVPPEVVQPELPTFKLDETVPVSYDTLGWLSNNFNTDPWETGGNWIGEGGFADVYYGVDGSAQKVAIKRLKKNSELSEKQFKAEITSLVGKHHENILPVLGYSIDGPYHCIVYKFAPLGSLEHRIACKNNTLPLRFETRVSIAKQTAEGIHFLHNCRLIHRDVTCANILLDTGYVVKLGDFGQVKLGPNLDAGKTSVGVTSQIVMTQVYAPPEAVFVSTTKQDVYAYGMVLLVLLTGLAAFDDDREDEEKSLKVYVRENCDDIMEIVDDRAGDWPAVLARGMHELADRCLTTQRPERPYMKEIIEIIRGWPTYE